MNSEFQTPPHPDPLIVNRHRVCDFCILIRLKRDSANVKPHQRRSRASHVRTLRVFPPIFSDWPQNL